MHKSVQGQKTACIKACKGRKHSAAPITISVLERVPPLLYTSTVNLNFSLQSLTLFVPRFVFPEQFSVALYL
jgi:hypothetical protein